MSTLSRPLMLIRLLVIFILTSATTVTESAQVYEVKNDLNPQSCSSYWFEMVGEIEAGDAKTLEAVIKNLHKKFHNATNPDGCMDAAIRLKLNSSGGGVLAAMALGRVIRKYELVTIIGLGGECLSSCVLALLGGVQREIYGSVGVHRPYFNDLAPAKSVQEISNIRRQLNSEISNYLDTMNVPRQILDVMLSTVPEKIRILTRKEMEELRVIGTDPDFDERRVARLAYEYGITSSEYRRRDTRAIEKCRSREKEDSRCREAILLGVPVKYVNQIEERIWERCVESIVDGVTPEKQVVECVRAERMKK